MVLGACALIVGTLSGCSASAADRTMTIAIEHSRFSVGSFDVEPGSTVKFVIVNTDPIDHEFLIGDREMQDIHEQGTEAHHGARPGEISIPAGEERTTTYTFPTTSEPLLFGCHLPGHYAYGMKGTIELTG
jgi:uncharacterized cupredoxin-like copper-binding protein